MGIIVQWSAYEQISTNNLNNMSKYMIEYVLNDIAKYCIANQKCVAFSEDAIVEQNTGTDYNVVINPHISINDEGKIFVRTTITSLVVAVPSANPRVDIVQAEMGYSDADSQVRYFINPSTGVVSTASTYTQFLLDAVITIKQGSEGTGVAPTVDSGKVKLAEIYVDTSGGVSDLDIYNVDSDYGENNTGWTIEHAVTTKLKQLQNHRVQTILDHPDGSVTIEKLDDGTIQNARSFCSPSVTIPNGSDIVIHEITVPAGKTMTILNLGISIQDDGTPDSDLTIEAGDYTGATFTPQNTTYERNTDFSSSNTFVATTAVQIRIFNDTASAKSATGHVVYTLT